MKTLEELGISPAPWDAGAMPGLDWVIVWINEENRTAAERTADALLIYAAPDLYAALRDCVTQMCEYCRKEAERSLPDRTCENGCAVMLAAKAALEKAGGGK